MHSLKAKHSVALSKIFAHHINHDCTWTHRNNFSLRAISCNLKLRPGIRSTAKYQRVHRDIFSVTIFVSRIVLEKIFDRSSFNYIVELFSAPIIRRIFEFHWKERSPIDPVAANLNGKIFLCAGKQRRPCFLRRERRANLISEHNVTFNGQTIATDFTVLWNRRSLWRHPCHNHILLSGRVQCTMSFIADSI